MGRVGAAATPLVDQQRLYVARYGLQTAMVWAGDRYVAVERVRKQAWRRTLTRRELARLPVRVRGEVRCRLATANDVETWLRAEGDPAAVEGWPGLDALRARLGR